jgi:hypothetical protein
MTGLLIVALLIGLISAFTSPPVHRVITTILRDDSQRWACSLLFVLLANKKLRTSQRLLIMDERDLGRSSLPSTDIVRKQLGRGSSQDISLSAQFPLPIRGISR